MVRTLTPLTSFQLLGQNPGVIVINIDQLCKKLSIFKMENSSYCRYVIFDSLCTVQLLGLERSLVHCCWMVPNSL